MPEREAHLILVHGSFHGPWCWDRLVNALPRSVSVTTPELASTSFEQHVATLSDTLTETSADDPALVLHSYAGMIAADALARSHVRPRRTIFLDAFLPLRGENAFELLGDLGSEMASIPGDMIPPPPPEALGVEAAEDCTWLASKLVPFPKSTHEISSSHDALAIENAAYIRCALFPGFAEAEQRAMAAGWPCRSIEAGHDAMITAPVLLADAIAGLAL